MGGNSNLSGGEWGRSPQAEYDRRRSNPLTLTHDPSYVSVLLILIRGQADIGKDAGRSMLKERFGLLTLIKADALGWDGPYGILTYSPNKDGSS